VTPPWKTKRERPKGLTIDELAARSGVPSRTIRFYQARGILDRPRRIGRKALYDDRHVERLALIAQLQARGLRISGMKQLLARKDSDEAVAAWLGLKETLAQPWSDERPQLITGDDLRRLLQGRPAGLLASGLEQGYVQKHESAPDTYVIRSPRFLELILRLLDAGLHLEFLQGLEPVLRDHIRRAVDGMAEYFLSDSAVREGRELDEDFLRRTVQSLRLHGPDLVRLVFAEEVEKALNRLLEHGTPPQKPRRPRPHRD
jgi:DNA-binding transcriptional MerR regulator